MLSGINYYSNTNTLGIYPTNLLQPSISPFVSYYDKSGLILSLMPFFIKNADSSLNNNAAEVDIQAGYRWTLNSHLSVTPSYVHFFYSRNMNEARSMYTDYISLAINAQTSWIFAIITPAYVFGNDGNFGIVEAQGGFTLNLDKILGRNQLLFLQPSVNLNFNNQYYYHKYALDYFAVFLEPYLAGHPKATVGDFRNYLTYNYYLPEVRAITHYLNFHPKIDKAFSKLSNKTIISTLFAVNTRFNLSYIEVPVPFTYAYRNLVLKFSASIYRPLNAPSFIDSKWDMMYTVGLAYLLNW